MKWPFGKKEGWQPHHHHINYLLFIAILLITVIIVLIRPALTGYSIAKEFKDSELTPTEMLRSMEAVKGDLKVKELELQSCEEDTSDEQDKMAACLADAETQKTDYEKRIERLENDIKNLKPEYEAKKVVLEAELQQATFDLAELERSYEEVVKEMNADYQALKKNAANNICCKARVDDKSIDSFKVVNGAIVCGSGEAERISC